MTLTSCRRITIYGARVAPIRCTTARRRLKANGHKHALQRFLLALGDPYKILRVVPVRGGSTVTLKADAVVFRKATQETYRAFFDLDPKQVPYPLTDKLRVKQYARKSAPCENAKSGAAA